MENARKLENDLIEQVEIEKHIQHELDELLEQIRDLPISSINFTDLDQNIFDLDKSSKQLSSKLDIASSLSNKINLQIHELDIASSRVIECQKRVQDLLDLRVCSDGVTAALNDSNYEKAAMFVHRFLLMDQHLIEQAADKTSEDHTTESLKILRNATTKLKNQIILSFREAVSHNDKNGVEKFFKLFPLLDMHKDGLMHFSNYLKEVLKITMEEKMGSIKTNDFKERKHGTLFADVITHLFEVIAKIITDHKPMIETYYECGMLIEVIPPIQKVCDSLSKSILDEFKKQRDWNNRVRTINDFLRSNSSSSSKPDQTDPKDVDILLHEVIIIHARYKLYTRFLRIQIMEDFRDDTKLSEKYKQVQARLETLISSSELSKNMQSLIGEYLLLERYYMEQCIRKAMNMDIVEKETLSSTMVDDIFFIVKKCIRRACGSDNIDAVCAVINNACPILETDVCNTLKQQLRQGYTSGYLDLTQAYNVMMQGRLQQSDPEQTRILFLVYLNNCNTLQDYSETLAANLKNEINCGTQQEMEKLNYCLAGFSSAVKAFSIVREYGLQQLKNSVVKPRVAPWVNSFLSVSHNLSQEEFSSYEANEPFVRGLICNLDSLLTEFKTNLTASNYDSFVSMIVDEVTLQLEKDIMKSEFSRLGGLALDKEIRSLVNYLSDATSWSVREKFAKLLQISLILNLEKVTEILEYFNTESCNFTWRLTTKEIRNVLSLRKDFRSNEIKDLKL